MNSAVHWPDGYVPDRARVFGAWVVILAASIEDPYDKKVLVRRRGAVALAPIMLPGGRTARDMVVLHGHGVFVLCATSSAVVGGVGWDEFVIVRLNLEHSRADLVHSDKQWEQLRRPYVLRLLGCSPDGNRLAVACGRHADAENSSRMEYRLGYLSPETGGIELQELLEGLIF